MPKQVQCDLDSDVSGSREHQEQVEREKALKEAKASAESNGGEDKASLKAVQELLREATKRCDYTHSVVSKQA